MFLVPDADPLVGRLRLAHDPAARAGIGAHVTLLFPFVPPPRLDDSVLARLREQCARDPAIRGAVELRFDHLARFAGGVSYLALADPESVASKIRALAAAWPDYPPYEGLYPDSVPHLTVAHGDDPILAAAEAELASALPVVSHMRFVSLLVERDGQWHPHTKFPLEAETRAT